MQELNASNGSNVTAQPPAPVVTQGASVLLGICWILGVPGNMVVLWTLKRRLSKGSRRCFTLWLMLHLAVADLVTLVTLPAWIEALVYGWWMGSLACKLFSYLIYWGLYTSVLCVALLSVQRYVQVLYPRRWAALRATRRRSLLGLVWGLGALVSLHALVQRDVEEEKDGLLHCLPRYRRRGEQAATLLLESLLMFVLPFSAMASFYVAMHRRVKQTAGSAHGRFKRLVVRIVFVFFILSIPVHLNNLLTIVALATECAGLLGFCKITGALSGALIFINSCVNPLLYALNHRAILQKSWVTTLTSTLRPNEDLGPEAKGSSIVSPSR